MRAKSVSLTFRGFEMTAEEVVRLMGVSAFRLGNRGDPVKVGVKTILTRSYAIFSRDFSTDSELIDMLPALVEGLGGYQRLLDVREAVRPEFLEIHFDLPTRTSEYSQDGYLSPEVIARVFQLKATISLGFF